MNYLVRYLLHIVYSALLVIFALLLLPVIVIALIVVPKFRAGFFQKLGFYYLNLPHEKKTIWIHAVSVGEVNAVESLVKETKARFQGCNIVLSTVTKTGHEVAKKKLSDVVDAIVYFPFDFNFSVFSALTAIRPSLVVIAETEIWPNFSFMVNAKKIPLMIVNGRISPHSYRGYRKFSFFFRDILSNYSSILMQTESDKERIINIGAPEEKVEVMGNLKFNFSNILDKEKIAAFRQELHLVDKKLLIAGSTHKGEDEIVLDVFASLREEIPSLKLLLAPRHPERFLQVEDLVSQLGISYGFRSKHDTFENKDIILLDTVGELGKMYSLCEIAFIGGSFSHTGGHNPLESTIYNKPVISGPDVFNFKDIYQILTADGAACIVCDKKEFYNKALELLSDKIVYRQACDSCKTVFEKNTGALEYALKKMEMFL